MLTDTHATPTARGDPAAQPERRTPQRRADRRALMRLRQAEFVAADYLPADLMQELTAAIEGVVGIVRGAAAGDRPDAADARACETLRRWALERAECLRDGEAHAARQIGGWLFGAGILAQDLGLLALRDLALQAHADDPADPIGPPPPPQQVQP